ncbi:hypothetical protein EC973_000016 [Apophysomyces ossiformis]|uniref:V-SNARE coiled-coil homology domain-containing protein n=1 Tax=Apophysomyces ossiformis TaxID=679940 RepID=A0A8H7EUA7_9FUNG|nr:hypothetical protein EC973_000016 [Apophysomyces ossiformis]
MTIFDKISGLAQRAKDNAVAKSFLSKDTRLERSLSENVDIASMTIAKISTYGLPDTVSVVAFDPVSGLLAIETIKYMLFKTGYPLLVIVDKKNVITTIDLKTKRTRHRFQAQGIITSVEYCTGTDWLFFGSAEGAIDTFDLHLGMLAKVSIPNLLTTVEKDDGGGAIDRLDHVVVALQMHPTNLDFILIGYSSVIFLWDIREHTIRRAFTLRNLDVNNPLRNARLTCFTWSPRGDRIVGGYDDGYMHFWDANNDQMPIFSRQALQSHLPPSASPDPCEPVYQLAWYVDTTLQKTYLLVAGGSSIPEIRGIHVLEFDLDSESKDARKQSIIHSPVDVVDFIFICREPYFLGMHNPFGVLVIGSDNVLRAYSFDHGYPLLTLPPALDFLEPAVMNICQAFMVPETTFRKLCTANGSQGPVKYLPLTGGIAGNGHVYKIPSNDIFMTIHSDEAIKFWDAAFTSLRPLPYLTVHCKDGMNDPKAQVCCVDLNPKTGCLSVGCSDGTILVYEFVTALEQSSDVNDKVIENCDSTLKEISDLLKDMEETTAEQPDGNDSHEQENKPEEVPLENDRPLTDDTASGNATVNSSFANIRIEPLEFATDITGYVLKDRVILGHVYVEQIVSHGEDIIAFSTSDGSIIAVDIKIRQPIFCININDYEEKQQEDTESGKHTHKDASIQTFKPVIACLQIADSYSVAKPAQKSTFLYVGLSNGQVYQYEIGLNSAERRPLPVVIPAFDDAVLDISVINLEGETPNPGENKAESASSLSPPEEDFKQLPDNRSIRSEKSTKSIKSVKSTKSVKEEKPNPDSAESLEKNTGFSLLRKPSRKGSKSRQKADSKEPVPAMPRLPDLVQIERIKHTRHDYIYQQDPHFLILVSATAISVYLSGFNVKLYGVELVEHEKHQTATAIRSKVIRVGANICTLAVLLDDGHIRLFSLPALKPLHTLRLENYMPERLREATLSADGRVTLWTQKYELEQRTFMPQNQIPFGEDILLHNGDIMIPPHPSTATQRPKKSWLDTVSGAFKKNVFTIHDLDMMMGRVPAAAAAAEAQSSKASGNEAAKPQPQRSGVFKELSDKMNERGERLNELDQKFQDMNVASSDFLRAVREYNERQARKKWWEF